MWPLTASQHRGWTGRGLRAALASLLLPGLGQLLLGRRRKGAALIAAALAVAVFAGWLASRGATTVAGWVVRPEVLRWLIGANLALLVFRLYATFDAYADGAGHATVGVPPQRGWKRAGITCDLRVMSHGQAISAGSGLWRRIPKTRSDQGLCRIVVSAVSAGFWRSQKLWHPYGTHRPVLGWAAAG